MNTAGTVRLAFQLAAQALVFVLLSFQFGDQFFARGRTPARRQVFVMP